MSLAEQKAEVAERLHLLGELREDKLLDPRDYRRMAGPLNRELLGDREYEHTRLRKRLERRRIRARMVRNTEQAE